MNKKKNVYRVRSAEQVDQKQIEEIRKENQRQLGFVPITGIKSMIARRQVWVAYETSKPKTVLGYIVATAKTGMKLMAIAVHKDHRRKGIGTKLISAAKINLEYQGKVSDPTTLKIIASNPEGIAFFRSFGFKPYFLEERAWTARGVDLLWMIQGTTDILPEWDFYDNTIFNVKGQ